jgi:hypothetical protein
MPSIARETRTETDQRITCVRGISGRPFPLESAGFVRGSTTGGGRGESTGVQAEVDRDGSAR